MFTVSAPDCLRLNLRSTLRKGQDVSGPQHVPVMRDEVLAVLQPALQAPGAVVVDATLGLGGHAAALLTAHPGVRLIGLDRDPRALAVATDRLAAFRAPVTPGRAVYDAIPHVLASPRNERGGAAPFDLAGSPP